MYLVFGIWSPQVLHVVSSLGGGTTKEERDGV
jgi:hypothetical protein